MEYGLVCQNADVGEQQGVAALSKQCTYYGWTNDDGTKIYVPFEKFFKIRCHLDSDTWDQFAPNSSNSKW
jgi:hypothetical protein